MYLPVHKLYISALCMWEKINCIKNVKKSDKAVLFIFTDIIGKNQSKNSL